MMKRNGQYWKQTEIAALGAATTYTDLLHIALAVVGRMPQPIAQVCGPISTGGRGNVRDNLAVFDATIEKLLSQGINVFDQVPFEEPMVRMRSGDTYDDRLLFDFYLPLFESGAIARFYFIYGWQSSKGATWEREQAKRLGIEIKDLPPDFVA